MLEKLPPVLGHALRDRRAGLDKIVFNRSGLRTGMGLIKLSSLAFVVGLPPGDGKLREGALDSPEHEGEDVQEGRNSFLRAGWLPPDPPPGHGQHRYVFQLFALGPGKAFTGKPGRDDVLEAIQQRAIASGMMIGTYERPDGSIRADAPAAVRVLPPA